MRSAPVLAATALAVVAAISGCGHQHAGSSAGNSGGGAPVGAPSATAQSSAAPLPGCGGAGSASHGSLVIHNSDNGRTLCVRSGTAVLVLLKDGLWAPIHAKGAALQPRADGRLMLMRGVTGASFAALQPGTAVVSSFRDTCGPNSTPGNGESSSGTLECGTIIGFQVTVKVVA